MTKNRKRIIELMRERAMSTGRSNRLEFMRLTKEINRLQREESASIGRVSKKA